MNLMSTRDASSLQRHDDVVIDLRDVAKALWRGSWLILILACVGAALGVKELHNHVPHYEAVMVVSPTSGEMGMQMPSQMGVLSGLGLSVSGRAQATLFDRLQQAFSSMELARRMQAKHDLLHVVYRGSWDEEAQSWIRPEGTRFEWREAYLSFLNQPIWRAPELESLANYLGGSLVVEEPKESPFLEVKVLHSDPEFALFLLTTAYTEADNLLRDQDRNQIAERQAYLRNQLATAELSDIRRMLLDLLGQEVRRGMLLESNLPYAARIIEPARVSSEPVPPNMRFEIGWRMVLAILLGVVIVVSYHLLRRR